MAFRIYQRHVQIADIIFKFHANFSPAWHSDISCHVCHLGHGALNSLTIYIAVVFLVSYALIKLVRQFSDSTCLISLFPRCLLPLCRRVSLDLRYMKNRVFREESIWRQKVTRKWPIYLNVISLVENKAMTSVSNAMYKWQPNSPSTWEWGWGFFGVYY